MSSLAGHPFIANGTIQPSRIVKIDTTSGKNFYVIQATANTESTYIGISQEGSEDAPGTTGAATDAARVGVSLQVYGPGDIALLTIGSGGCTAGDWLTSDANGQGVTASLGGTTVVYVIGKALETANSGERCRCLIVLGGITGT